MYRKGDKVRWWSHLSTGMAIFVEYDEDMPKHYCILAIGIGVKPNRMVHTFRWPLSQVAQREEGRTITTKQRTKGV
jgi:hypothetical protein